MSINLWLLPTCTGGNSFPYTFHWLVRLLICWCVWLGWRWYCCSTVQFYLNDRWDFFQLWITATQDSGDEDDQEPLQLEEWNWSQVWHENPLVHIWRFLGYHIMNITQLTEYFCSYWTLLSFTPLTCVITCVITGEHMTLYHYVSIVIILFPAWHLLPQSLSDSDLAPQEDMPWFGYKFVGDNIDKSVKPSHQHHEQRGQSLHHFHG